MTALAIRRPDSDPAPSRIDRRPWTAAEMAVLHQHYLTGGAAACLPHLPGRGLKQIHTKAVSLNLRRQKQHSIAKESTDFIDAAIRRFYRETQPRGAHTALAKRLGVTRQWLSTRAATLGVLPVTRTDMQWTPDEEALLEEHNAKKAERIASIFRRHGYHRTPGAIGDRLRTLGISRLDPDVFTATELSRCMGVDTHVPLRWIERHGLKAKRIGEGRTVAWEIRRKDLREFLIRSADCDHRRCTRAWLVDILTGAKE
jgi:hypothetical protein